MCIRDRYSRENLEAFAALLARKEEELGRKLYVISDEPSREITYGAEVPYVPVSYTHLDVYKRQALHDTRREALRCSFWPFRVTENRVCLLYTSRCV